MLAINIPVKLPIPFASAAGAGYIRQVPTASQIGITDGAASLTDGFPPLNFISTEAGGTPPWGADMNGIINQISAWSRWQSAGGPIAYDAAFSALIGGYPAGATLSAAVLGAGWISLVDNNTSDPDTGGANWAPFPVNTGFTRIVLTGGTSWTVPILITRYKVTLVGGGASGATGQAGPQGGGGGGGGGATVAFVTGVTPLSTVAFTIGAGGTGVATATGNNGGDTTFGSLVAHGGTGASSTAGGAGGSASGGDPMSGSYGTGGLTSGGGSGLPIGGLGGANGLGQFAPSADAATGSAGAYPGMGGSGAGSIGATSGAGAPGRIVVEY